MVWVWVLPECANYLTKMLYGPSLRYYQLKSWDSRRKWSWCSTWGLQLSSGMIPWELVLSFFMIELYFSRLLSSRENRLKTYHSLDKSDGNYILDCSVGSMVVVEIESWIKSSTQFREEQVFLMQVECMIPRYVLEIQLRDGELLHVQVLLVAKRFKTVGDH